MMEVEDPWQLVPPENILEPVLKDIRRLRQRNKIMNEWSFYLILLRKIK
jgi:hypothetical protein